MRKPGSFQQIPGGVKGVPDPFHLNCSNLYKSYNSNKHFNIFSQGLKQGFKPEHIKLHLAKTRNFSGSKEHLLMWCVYPGRILPQPQWQSLFWCGWNFCALLKRELGPVSLYHVLQFPDMRIVSRPLLLSCLTVMQEDHSGGCNEHEEWQNFL